MAKTADAQTTHLTLELAPPRLNTEVSNCHPDFLLGPRVSVSHQGQREVTPGGSAEQQSLRPRKPTGPRRRVSDPREAGLQGWSGC